MRKWVWLSALFGMLCAGEVPAEFVHPGGMFKRSDLQRMRSMVLAKQDPWHASFLEFKAYPYASYEYEVRGDGDEIMHRGKGSGNRYIADTEAAYCNALMWAITQDERHAEKCVAIFKVWSEVTDVPGIPLEAGLYGWKMLEAAEIIKSTYPNWPSGAIKRFKAMWVHPGYSDRKAMVQERDPASFYWKIYRGDPGRHGNQDILCMRTLVSMGVFLDNRKIYDRGLRYFKGLPARVDDLPMPTGPSEPGPVLDETEYYRLHKHMGTSEEMDDYGYNGVLTNLFWINGQAQESSRDQHHTFLGLATAAGIAEVAWTQGDPVWNAYEHHLLRAFEYSLKYNTSFLCSYPDQPKPWEPTAENGEFIQRYDRTGRWFSKAISPQGRGDYLNNKRPVFEQPIAHYNVRMGMNTNDYIWTLRSRDLALEKDGYETAPRVGWIADQPGWGALTFRRPPLTAGDPVKNVSEEGMPVFFLPTLPAKIEAENYDWFSDHGEGHTYHDLTPTNSGGCYRHDAVDISRVGQMTVLSDLEKGEWLTYTIDVPKAGAYQVAIRYAATDDHGSVSFSFGNRRPSAINALPKSDSWKKQVVVENVELTAGTQAMRMYIESDSDSLIIDCMVIAPVK